MQIGTNEFPDLSTASEAHRQFPYCAVCKSGNKIQVLEGRYFLICIKNFWHGKHGIKSTWKEEK